MIQKKICMLGAAGCLLVVDGSRPTTLDAAVRIRANAEALLGPVPFVVAVNKSDLKASGAWRLADAGLAGQRARGWTLVETSALSGAGVEETFSILADRVRHVDRAGSDPGEEESR